MKPRKAVWKYVAIASSLVLLGAYVGYKAFGSKTKAAPDVAPGARTPAGDQAQPPPAEFIRSTKSGAIFEPAPKPNWDPTLLPGSKDLAPLIEPKDLKDLLGTPPKPADSPKPADPAKPNDPAPAAPPAAPK